MRHAALNMKYMNIYITFYHCSICCCIANSWLAVLRFGWLEYNVPFQHKYGYIREERSAVKSYPLTQWRKASDIFTLILATFLFSSHPKRERDREDHLNYYASAYNRRKQLSHRKTKLNQIQQNTRINLNQTIHLNCFTALFPGPHGWASARRERLDFMVQGKINRDRHTDHPAGRHSIRINQSPPPPSQPPPSPPFFLQAGCPSCRQTKSVKPLKATSAFGLGRRC